MIEADDPATAFALTQEALGIAERLGVRDDVLWFTTQIVFGLLDRGRSEEAKALLAQYPVDEVPEIISFFFRGSHGWLAVLEGRFDEVPAILAEMDRIAATMSNPEYSSTRFFNRAMAAEVQRDYATAAESLGRALKLNPSFAGGINSWHGRMLVRSGRLGEARAELEILLRSSERGRRFEMDVNWLRAVLAAADESPEAPALFQAVIQRGRELDMQQWAVFAAYDYASLVGIADTGARIAAEEALEISRRAGWHGITALFEPLFEGDSAAVLQPADKVESGDAIPAGGAG
jgi:hypothetical protein